MRSDRRSRRRRRRLYPLLASLLVLAGVGAVLLTPSFQQSPSSAALPPPDLEEAEATPKPGRTVAAPGDSSRRIRPEPEPIRWRNSVAVGDPAAGSLERGVMLPAEGRSWVSWDPILKRRPSREWRRWGTDTLIRTTLRVLREFGAEHPSAPRIAIGDLSLPEGGDFGPEYGFIGHASHQNGLDIDIYYPRTDRRARPPKRPSQVDLRLSQDLLDRFVAAGAEKVFSGPSLPLTGPPGVVVPLVHHDNHLHIRLPGP